MPYRFAAARQNYADYAAGKVSCALPGRPAFPIRLAIGYSLRLAFGLARGSICIKSGMVHAERFAPRFNIQ
jgi:hypothetical protein